MKKDHWPLWKLEALMRVSKTKARPFFRDPRSVIALRKIIEDKKIVDQSS